MGLEGAVKLGFRKELAALEDPVARKALFDRLVAAAYEQGKGLSFATYFEIDDVIDPADSRAWITNALRAAPPHAPRAGKKRRNVDTW
jgi:acetyl-CoA carboxylase carboxyltransferase component